MLQKYDFVTGIESSTPPAGTSMQSQFDLKADKTTTITGADGLTGGGDLSANRTITLPAVGTAGTYGSASQVPVFTTDAKGRVSAVTNTLISILLSQISNFKLAKMTAQVTNNSNVTLSNLTELELTVTAGKTYKINGYLLYRTVATTTGITFTFTNATAAGTISMLVRSQTGADAVNNHYVGNLTSFGDLVTTPSVQATATDYILVFEGLFVCTVSGTITPQFRSEVNTSNVIVQAGSSIEALEI